jgi:alpha-galactosidase
VKQVIKPDLCWRDAMSGGQTWYPSSEGPFQGGNNWLNTGTWDIDEQKFPGGFKSFSDWLHAHDMKFILWFEPERVGNTNTSFLAKHPEWLLPGTASSVGAILNEGNPEAFHWLTNHIQNIIKANGLDWYREDMNGDGPLLAWRNNDAPDRQGITENFYVQGHLAFWDALIAMNPGLRVDSCASGGRRDDLETMRRAVPLLRSDFQFPSQGPNMIDGNQCHTYGLSAWLPYQGSGCYLNDPYSFRSFYMPSFGMAGEFQMPAWRQAYQENKRVAPILLNGDYYPLTSYSLANDVWMAWQFDWAEKGQGVVQAFRRGQNNESVKTYRLSGLNPKAQYKITNFDVEGTVQMSGKKLMEDGLRIELKNKSQAAVITYEKVK